MTNQNISEIETPAPYAAGTWPVRGRGSDYNLPVRIVEKEVDADDNTVINGRSSAKVPMNSGVFLPPATTEEVTAILQLGEGGNRAWVRPKVIFTGQIHNGRFFDIGEDIGNYDDLAVVTYGEKLGGRYFISGWFPTLLFASKGYNPEIVYEALGWKGYLRISDDHRVGLRYGEIQKNSIYCSTRNDEVSHIALLVR